MIDSIEHMYKIIDFIRMGTQSAIAECLPALHEGAILCVPTDTVYGLICAVNATASIQRLADLKRRPPDKPFALFVPSQRFLEDEPFLPCRTAQQLADHFWPGPLTLVVPAAPGCSCAHEGTVGVRAPAGDFIRALLNRWDGWLVNTSLNRSGDSPVWSIHPEMEILREVDMVIDAGELPVKMPSAVVDCTVDPPRVLRAGDISQTQIDEILSTADEEIRI